MVGRDFHCGGLKVEELVPEVPRDAEFGQAGPRFLRQVVSDLDVDVVRRDELLSRPAFIDDLSKVIRDIHTPVIVPAVFEPSSQLLAGVVIHDIDVQFALVGKSR